MPGLGRKLSSKRGREEAASDVSSAQREATTESAEEEEEAEAARPDGFEGHRPEFLSRELSSKGWKPSLRTIEERVAPKKTPHWLF